ncbi:group II intron reverse transcriptase/maturase [Rivularia sp. UHCC 0363]|uniref:group II intron reverse transcriptase/maturase n=1 Tax=Rivularia sp. UHCC 0363 TaxID=3110244 RepID=UPI002B1F2662|nr:group II intron reverse transcriptase/maturase [Rivularia sp. UHCC 0363]MEA5599358.1 group II intron reverse transcriptase/maturase [Rivularia sp. UHCC 0363]
MYKLQNRIYQAAQRGDIKTYRRLQKLLLKSWYSKALAVRRISQDNKGKKTAGVDGVKSLTPPQRLRLTLSLSLKNKADSIRRVWIPKPGKKEKRPLGIPTIRDRALQTLVKMALEPEWEARFEPNSYGFRSGRSCHDAIEAIFLSIRRKPKYALDADIAKCFDKINHEALLSKINTFPQLRRQIRAWLKVGVVDKESFTTTETGTPQGGGLSPLLANIALHGMEERIKQYAETLDIKRSNGRQISRKNKRSAISLIRYADDFVILHEREEVVKNAKIIISEWLKKLGLELKQEKTSIVHTLNPYNGKNPGFNFLGFNIRQHFVGKTHSKNGFKTITSPSRESCKSHLSDIEAVIKSHKAAPQLALIKKLNPIINGWANYYSTGVSSEIFQKLGYMVYEKLRAWAWRRHPKKSKSWIVQKYWKTIGDKNWEFVHKKDGKTHILAKHSDKSIVRHIMVKNGVSPYDGNLVYWSNRHGKNPLLPNRIALLLKKQKGVCPHCDMKFLEHDVMEVDHIIPKSKGATDTWKNLQLLHRHCHDEKTATDGSLSKVRKKSAKSLRSRMK